MSQTLSRRRPLSGGCATNDIGFPQVRCQSCRLRTRRDHCRCRARCRRLLAGRVPFWTTLNASGTRRWSYFSPVRLRPLTPSVTIPRSPPAPPFVTPPAPSSAIPLAPALATAPLPSSFEPAPPPSSFEPALPLSGAARAPAVAPCPPTVRSPDPSSGISAAPAKQWIAPPLLPPTSDLCPPCEAALAASISVVRRPSTVDREHGESAIGPPTRPPLHVPLILRRLQLGARAAIRFGRFGRRFGGCVWSGAHSVPATHSCGLQMGAIFGFDVCALSLQTLGGDTGTERRRSVAARALVREKDRAT